MTISLADVLNVLCCPDDEGRLSHACDELLCCTCGRRFPVHEENLVEILPRAENELPFSTGPAEYREGYKKAFAQSYQRDSQGLAWGAEELMPPSWVVKRRRQVEFVRPLITKGTERGKLVLCDISAGAGYYTMAYADVFRFVLHCDLSLDNLTYAQRKARLSGIQNILFVRADYFSPPFRNTLDRVLCMDTLIRGETHESLLLTAMAKSLAPGGFALVDFHNWWHNPVRRLGLLPENFRGNQSYSRRNVERILSDAGVRSDKCFAFHQEFQNGGSRWSFLSRLIPATRFVFRIHGANGLMEAGNGRGQLSG